MPAVDLIQEWQRAEGKFFAAYRTIYAKLRRGAYVNAEELADLAELSRAARAQHRDYVASVTCAGPPAVP
ncbi:hypothetical protein ACQ86G_23960 [Roseateles chitinivorans]|uniref:hypothetical protein n=1 Tax=Roseateles chitinivorans TaxID=2917965 RepID=UPI003D67EC9B